MIEQKKLEDYRYYNLNIFQLWPNRQLFLQLYHEISGSPLMQWNCTGLGNVLYYKSSQLLGFHSVIVCRKSSCASWHCLASVNPKNFEKIAPKSRVSSLRAASLNKTVASPAQEAPSFPGGPKPAPNSHKAPQGSWKPMWNQKRDMMTIKKHSRIQLWSKLQAINCDLRIDPTWPAQMPDNCLERIFQ